MSRPEDHRLLEVIKIATFKQVFVTAQVTNLKQHEYLVETESFDDASFPENLTHSDRLYMRPVTYINNDPHVQPKRLNGYQRRTYCRVSYEPASHRYHATRVSFSDSVFPYDPIAVYEQLIELISAERPAYVRQGALREFAGQMAQLYYDPESGDKSRGVDSRNIVEGFHALHDQMQRSRGVLLDIDTMQVKVTRMIGFDPQTGASGEAAPELDE